MICTNTGKYLALEIPRPLLVFDEELYKKKINEILESRVNLKLTQAPIKEGDDVLIKLCGFDEHNKEITFSEGDKYQTIIGTGQIRKEFELALLGRKMGESFTTHLAFPGEQNFYDGKPIRFEITVMSVYDRSLPELSDELVAMLGINGVNTVVQLENFTKAHVLELKKRNLDDTLRNTIMDRVIETSSFEIAEEEIQEKFNARVIEFHKIISNEGLSLHDHLKKLNMTEDEFLHKLREKVLHQIKYRCVIDKIAALENIFVSDEEVFEITSKVAEEFNLSFDEFILSNPDGYEGVKKDVLKKKVVEFIISTVKFY